MSGRHINDKKENNGSSAFSPDEYDREIMRTLPYYNDFYRQAAGTAAAHSPGALTWLDLGCGTGRMAQEALARNKLRKFVFCDRSPEMIGIARERFEAPCRQPGLQTEFIVSDIRELELTEKFDVITSIQVNHYLRREAREDVLRKCCSALKPGGLYIGFENFAPESEAGKRLYLDRWKAYQMEQGKSEDECSEHLRRYGREYFPITISEQLALLKSCGFRAAELLWVSCMQAGFLGIKQGTDDLQDEARLPAVEKNSM